MRGQTTGVTVGDCAFGLSATVSDRVVSVWSVKQVSLRYQVCEQNARRHTLIFNKGRTRQKEKKKKKRKKKNRTSNQ